MKSIKFQECTNAIGENQSEYRTMYAFVSGDDNGRVGFCWKLTLMERIKILFTGKLWHQVFTFNNALQPQLLSVEKPEMLKRL